MDAIEFYHTGECSTDIYEAMEQFNEYKSKRLLADELINLKKQIKRFKEGLQEINAINKYREAKSKSIETIIETLTKK